MKSNVSSTEKFRGFSKKKRDEKDGAFSRSKNKDSKRRDGNSGSGILRHDFLLVMKQSRGLLLLGLIVFAVLFPVSTCAVPDTSIFNVDYTHQQLKFRFCADEVLPLIQAASVIFGAACGMRLFGFLTGSQSDILLYVLRAEAEKAVREPARYRFCGYRSEHRAAGFSVGGVELFRSRKI